MSSGSLSTTSIPKLAEERDEKLMSCVVRKSFHNCQRHFICLNRCLQGYTEHFNSPKLRVTIISTNYHGISHDPDELFYLLEFLKIKQKINNFRKISRFVNFLLPNSFDPLLNPLIMGPLAKCGSP